MKKKFLMFICLICLSIALVACGNKKEETTKEFNIGVLSIDDSFPIYLAEKLNYFKDSGIKVNIIKFKSSIEESQAMEAGKIQMMMNDMVVNGILNKKEKKYTIVSTSYGANPKESRFVVLASKNSGVKRVEDFYGKKIAISNNTMMEYLLNSYFKYYNIDSNKVEFINIPNLRTRLETLLSGKIDGAILPDPLATLAIKKGAVPVIDDTKIEKNLSQSVLIVPNKEIKENKDVVKSVIKSINKAMNEINNEPQKYIADRTEFSNIPKAISESYPMPKYTLNHIPTESEFKEVYNWLLEKKIIKEIPSYKETISDEFVK